jgi:hypothetical protein
MCRYRVRKVGIRYAGRCRVPGYRVPRYRVRSMFLDVDEKVF